MRDVWIRTRSVTYAFRSSHIEPNDIPRTVKLAAKQSRRRPLTRKNSAEKAAQWGNSSFGHGAIAHSHWNIIILEHARALVLWN